MTKSKNGVGMRQSLSCWSSFSYRVPLPLHKNFFFGLKSQNVYDAKLHRAPFRPRCFLLNPFVLIFSLLFCFLDGAARWKSHWHHMSDILLVVFLLPVRTNGQTHQRKMFYRTVYCHLFSEWGNFKT